MCFYSILSVHVYSICSCHCGANPTRTGQCSYFVSSTDPCSHTLTCTKQNREEAQRAKDDLNGIMLHDNDLRIGWGKAIPIPAAPMFVLNPPGGVAPVRGAAIGPPGALTSSQGLWGAPASHQPNVPAGQQFATFHSAAFAALLVLLLCLSNRC